jgi:CheY-like chemotaxis protein
MARILVIDDEEVVRLTVSASLRHFRHSVSTAADGEEGINLFRKQRFDLVITDVRMPGLSGPEVIKVLRSLRPEVPVIIIGGGGSIPPVGTDAFARQVGADRVLQKPCGVLGLNAAVSELLDNAKVG